MQLSLKNFLQQNQCTIFYTVKGYPFTYEMRENGLHISRLTDKRTPTFTYTNLEKALLQMSYINNPSQLEHVRGASYCYTILKKYIKNNRQ